MHRLTIRIDFDDGSALGPGKVRLLELVAETGSIRKAAVRMKMSYRRAWLLLQALGQMFGEPLAETATGGKSGGGARLTATGTRVVSAYRRLEAASAKAAAREVEELAERLAKGRLGPPKPGRVRRLASKKPGKPGKIPKRKPA